MNKTSITVIKRKDAEIIATAKMQSALETKQTASVNEEQTKCRSRREMVGTVSNWISERRENSHLERTAAIRRLFGSEPALSEI